MVINMGFFEAINLYGGEIGIYILACFLSIALLVMYRRIKIVASVKAVEFLGNLIAQLFVVAPVALFVGFREITVGADTQNLWYGFINLGNSSFETALNHDVTGTLYYVASWIVNKITNANVQVWFSLLAFVTLLFIVKAVINWDLKYSGMALFVFYFCLGPDLLNQARQMLAVAIALYAFQYLFNKKYRVYFILSILAGLIHITALLCAIVLFFVQLLSQNSGLAVWKKILYWVILFVGMLFSSQIISILGDIFSSTKYSMYLTVDSSTNIGLGFILLMIPSVFPCIILRNYMDNDKFFNRAIYVTAPIRICGYVSYFIWRACYFFFSLGCIAFPYALEKTPKAKRRTYQIIVYLAIVFYFLIYCCWLNAVSFFGS